ncbi:MAG: Eco29kI family restriction endonuclease [Verrucomicrobiia bacterium]
MNPKPDPTAFNAEDFVHRLAKLLESLPVDLAEISAFSSPKLKGLRERMGSLLLELQRFSRALDPIQPPPFVFDPSDPKVIGELIARTLLIQPKRPLSGTGERRFYGSGVYAIYYRGDFHCYAPISGTENPIYVGKADPRSMHARTVEEQGTGLWTRLNDHKRSIGTAENLRLEDFDCRYLVVKSAWEETAENHLITYFKPVWNNEMEVCYGFGKHGDSGETRRNQRSPWDTLHSGRSWASAEKNVPNARSSREIAADIAKHFERHPPVKKVARPMP